MPKTILRTTFLGLFVLLGGCRLLVDVDAGGQVTSASGTADCGAGSNCIIDVPPGPYSETFTAVPDAGFTFSGWGGWCTGVQAPVCNIALPPDLTAFDFDGDVIAHFQPPIVGSWIAGSPDSADSFAVVTFYDNGGFVIVQSCDEEIAATNPNGGYEQGTYTWNPSTGAFNTTVLSDSIGGCGSREADGTLSFNMIEIDGDTMTLRSGGQTIETLSRIIPDTDDGLTGTWALGDARVPGQFAQVTFIGGQYYIVATECSDNDDGTGPKPPGMEYGTYNWNTRGKVVLWSQVRNTLGDCSVADSPPIFTIKRPWLEPHWGRIIRIAERGGVAEETLYRVR